VPVQRVTLAARALGDRAHRRAGRPDRAVQLDGGLGDPPPRLGHLLCPLLQLVFALRRAFATHDCASNIDRSRTRSNPTAAGKCVELRTEREGGSGAPVHDEHGTPGVRRDVGRHTAEDHARDAALAVGAEHDKARVAVVGEAGDPVPCWRFLDRKNLGAESSGLRQRGSLRGGFLGSLSDLVACRRVELDVGRRDEPDRERTPYGHHHGVPSRLELAACLLDREPGQIRAVIGEQHGAKVTGTHVTAPAGRSVTGGASEAPSRGPPYCPPASHASGSVRTLALEESRIRSSSGGEYHAGASPLIHTSSAGAGGRTRPSAYRLTANRVPPLAIPKQIHSAVRVPAAGLPPTVAATCANTGATANAATARSSSMIANTRCRALLRSEKPAMNRAGATEPPTPSPTSPE